MRDRRIAARDRRDHVERARAWVRSPIERHAIGDPIERRIAPSAQRRYRFGGAAGGGGFSPRGAVETITATLLDGAPGDGRRTRRRACRGPHGRATDVAQWAERLLDERAPRS